MNTHITCAVCGHALGNINEACPVCLPGFYAKWTPRALDTEKERLKTAAGAYVDALLAQTSDPAFSAKLMIANRSFLLSCMAAFACAEVARTLEELPR